MRGLPRRRKPTLKVPDETSACQIRALNCVPSLFESGNVAFCGLAVATQESAGRGSLGGLTATKHTEMTRYYVLKRLLADEARRSIL